MGVTAFPFDAVLDVTPSTLLGNDTATTAPAKALTTTQVRALLGVYTTAQVDALLSGKSDAGHTHAYSSLTGIPATFPPSAHNQAWSTITGTPTTLAGYGITDAAASGHTHPQSDVTGLTSALAAKADLIGGLVPANQLPSFVDDVLEYANLTAFPGTGESGKIYVAQDTSRTYRWGGSTYVELTDSTAVWGSISGVLANQTDLASALSGKSDTDHTHAYSSLTGIPSTFTPSAHKASHATGAADALSPSDIGAVPTSRQLTINGTAYDLSADRSWTVSGGIGGSTGSVDNALLRADGTGGATAQASGATLSDTSEMIIGDATNAGKLRLQDSGAYTTTTLFSIYLGGIYIGQNLATFTIKGDGEVYSYRGYACSTAGNGFTGHQFVFDGGWGSITRAVSTPTGNGNRLTSAGAWNINCATSNGVSITSNSGASTSFIQVYSTYTNSSNYERTALQFVTYSSARYAQFACESAGTGISNINLVLTPKGTGAFILGPPPDGTTTGGNARGTNAVDLQSGVKGSAAQVASGNNSFLGPQGGTASGTGAVAFGGMASGNSSFVFPGGGTASGVGAVCGYVVSGAQTVSGQGACAFGSSYSTVSGARSFLVAGDFNTVSGDACFSHGYLPGLGGPAVAGSGNFCTAGGASASSAVWALSCGQSAQVRHRGQRAFAAGRFSALADAQGCEWLLRNKTTDGVTAVTLFLDGSSERLTIPSGKILFVTAQIVGSKSDGTAVATYLRKFAIKNVGGTTTLVGSVETIGTDVAAGTSLSITADDTNDAVNPAVIGVNGETWRWVMTVYGVELAYGT